MCRTADSWPACAASGLLPGACPPGRKPALSIPAHCIHRSACSEPKPAFTATHVDMWTQRAGETVT